MRGKLKAARWFIPFLLSALAGCGGSQTAVPSTSTLAPAVAARVHAAQQRSWMAPEAQSEDLLYVSDQDGSVYVFSYPGGKLVGTLTGFLSPAGLCADKAGNVFVTDTPAKQLYEFKHGAKKPSVTLGDFGFYPDGCAIDPKSGNLAVTNYGSSPSLGPGGVSIYTRAKGHPATYVDPLITEYFFCTYDDDGNLFIDGTNYGSSQVDYAKLPRGGKRFVDLNLDKTIGYPAGIQWDGDELALEDASNDVLYRAKVSGTKVKIVGTTTFDGDRSTLLAQFWIQGHTIVMPTGTLSRRMKKIGFWAYPAGGKPLEMLRGPDAAELFGVTVSLAP